MSFIFKSKHQSQHFNSG